ncbi:MAG: PHP domain-containing protein [Planctomycetota bacterium]|jgi:error-prone DNA polymerase
MPEQPSPKARPHPWGRKAHSHEGTKAQSHEGTKAQRKDVDLDTPPCLRASIPQSLPPYADLHVTSNFTFLDGASHPEELVEQAAALGHRAIAITDRNSVAGIVRAHVAAREVGLPLVVGCRVEVGQKAQRHIGTEARREDVRDEAPQCLRAFVPPCLSLLLYPTDAASYGRLCRLLTIGKRRAPKGACHLMLHDVLEHHEGLLAVVIPPDVLDQAFLETVEGLKRYFDDDRLSVAAACRFGPDDAARLRQVAALSAHVGVPLAATNDVHCHVPARRALQDVLTCIRHGCTLAEAGFRLHAHAERHLKSPREMHRLLGEYPRALARTVEIATRAGGFSLDELRYQYPDEVCPPGRTPMQRLAELTWQGMGQRYPDGVPETVRRQVEHEFSLIDELNYAPYFLTVHDLVSFARGRGILCQGRGAAANSAVCYGLGVTAVDPDRIDLLFERFISHERNEPPDIDIDFEHERREEVIQYIYGKYGRDRAALTAEVITYRGRSAVREVGKVLGLSLDCVDRMAKNVDWWSDQVGKPDRLRELGLDPDNPTIRHVRRLAGEILGFPRHLSQHVGGFVITRGPLCELVPVENAAMPDRTVIEWDKDDIDAMGMLKVDVLGLGMLTCVRKAFEFVNGSDGGRKARRHEGVVRREIGVVHERDQKLSGSDRVATRDATGDGGVCVDSADAGVRTVRPGAPDATGGSVGAVQHRRGIRPSEHGGLPEASSDRPRVVGGAHHPGRGDRQPEDGQGRSRNEQPAGRNGSSAPGAHSQHRTEGTPVLKATDRTSDTSCLRASVPPCLDLHTVPPEDPSVYDMICHADTIGVFQIESRAQMQMLPRLRPRCFYDLVIEVAIVRPGPIQGDMVHPYLRRRNGEEPVSFPNDAVKKVLGKTLGVPLFQEQAMALAIVAAGFTPGEADQLRRAMAAWKRRGNLIEQFGVKFIRGMLARGYARSFAERCFNQIKGFSEYGFPESHAASFALIVYVSAWLKKHHPAAFAAALLNSQPMGFYAPAQIVRDAQEHGVVVRGVDVNWSGWDCTLEEGKARRHEGTEGREGKARGHEGTEGQREDVDPEAPPCLSAPVPSCLPTPPCLCASVPQSLPSSPALRLGLRLVKGLREDDGRAIASAAVRDGPFDSVEALWRASGVRVATMKRLASADAFDSMGLDRQAALWQVRALRDEAMPLFESVSPPSSRPEPALPRISTVKKVMHDYASLGLSLKAHPVSFIRDLLDQRGARPAADLADERLWPHGKPVVVAGLALVRQRPATAAGIVFITLEDETGAANLIVRPPVYERCRQAARHGIILLARGTIERQGEVVHVMTRHLETLDEHLSQLVARSRDFH